MLRDSPCGDTSKAATVAVTTRVVSFLIPLVAKLHVSSQLRWRPLTYRHRGCSATSQRAFKFLVANVMYKMTPRFFPLNAETCFCNLRREISPLSIKKKTSAMV